MQKEFRVAAFEQGQLHFLPGEAGGREAVLALPLTRLIAKMVRVPAEQDVNAVATDALAALSPYPDEPLLVSCEKVCDVPGGQIVLAAALPEGSADDIAEALDAAKISVVRIDALALGALRTVWGELGIAEGDASRRLVLLRSPDAITLLVLDGDTPVAIRAVADEADLEREKTLSLLEAEDFGGARDLAATVDREIDVDAALAGVRERSFDGNALDARPESWREVLAETRFKAKLVRNLALAGGVWLLAMGVLFGVPVAYGFMTDHVTELCRHHERAYKAVKDKRDKTNLVQKYSDHARGALEIMKAVSDRLPEGITLAGWEFDRADGVRIRGEATDKSEIYALKDALVKMGAEEEGGEAVFKSVELGTVSSLKDGTQKFDLECGYEEGEER